MKLSYIKNFISIPLQFFRLDYTDYIKSIFFIKNHIITLFNYQWIIVIIIIKDLYIIYNLLITKKLFNEEIHAFGKLKKN